MFCTACAHAQQAPLLHNVYVHPDQFWSASNPAFLHFLCGRVMMMAVIAIGSSNAFMPLRHFLVPNAAFCNTHAAHHRCLPAYRFLSIPASPSFSPFPSSLAHTLECVFFLLSSLSHIHTHNLSHTFSFSNTRGAKQSNLRPVPSTCIKMQENPDDPKKVREV